MLHNVVSSESFESFEYEKETLIFFEFFEIVVRGASKP